MTESVSMIILYYITIRQARLIAVFKDIFIEGRLNSRDCIKYKFFFFFKRLKFLRGIFTVFQFAYVGPWRFPRRDFVFSADKQLRVHRTFLTTTDYSLGNALTTRHAIRLFGGQVSKSFTRTVLSAAPRPLRDRFSSLKFAKIRDPTIAPKRENNRLLMSLVKIDRNSRTTGNEEIAFNVTRSSSPAGIIPSAIRFHF